MIFYKYHGTGNDFIIVENLKGSIELSKETIQSLCKRHMGIGADGLILIEHHDEADFYMRYFNSDGNKSSMCGNGGRCAVLFSKHIGLIESNNTSFHAADGLHTAQLLENDIIALKMNNAPNHRIMGKSYVIDTGSPHYVRFGYNIDNMNVYKEGRVIRNSAQFKKDGINVNFVEELNNELFVRTYERGVENETLSCGTGVTAAAVAAFLKTNSKGNQTYNVKTLGGKLQVKIEAEGTNIHNLWLIGPAKEVFIGEVNV